MQELQSLRMIFYNTFKSRNYFEMQRGSRPWHALLLITEGSFWCRMNEKEYHVEAGEIMFFPQNVYYERRVTSPITFHQFAFVTDDTDLCTSSLEIGKVAISKEKVFSLAKALERTAHRGFHNESSLLLHTISHILMENYISSDLKDITPPDKNISWAAQYISMHFNEDLRIEELAEKLHLSYTGFLWKFKNAMHCTPSEYLSHLRISYAKALLLDSDLQINEVAERCGYNNPFYFTNVFRKHIGCSPSFFRNTYSKENQV